MKNLFAKATALFITIAIIISLAACGDKNEFDGSTTYNDKTDIISESYSDNAETESDTDTANNSTEAELTSKNETSTNPSETQAISNSNENSVKLPTDVAAGVKLYNDAVAKIKSTNASIVRKINSAKATAGIIKIDLLSFDNVETIFAKGNGPINNHLSSLSSTYVKDFSSKDLGNSYELKFKLKEATCDQNTKVGAFGYMHFITMDEVEVLVKQMCGELTGSSDGVKVYKDQTKLILRDGDLTVNIDKTTGKITSATLSYIEVIDGKIKAPIVGSLAIDADANVEGACTVNYKFS